MTLCGTCPSLAHSGLLTTALLRRVLDSAVYNIEIQLLVILPVVELSILPLQKCVEDLWPLHWRDL